MSERVIALVPDAFGGRGGTALYNRHLLRAICSYPGMDEVVALPRSVVYGFETMPANLRYVPRAAGSKVEYLRAVARVASGAGPASLVICAHLNLLPFAHLVAARFRCGVLPICYGAEAWKPTRYAAANFFCRRIAAFVAIRKLTADRLKRWADIPAAKFYHLPNCVDVADYGVGPPRADLLARYGLQGRTVIMTVGRVDSTEKNKGFDEVIATLPLLLSEVPNLVYLVVGDGDDRPRLEAEARALGVGDRVVFAGYVSEAEKADHYRLAHVVAMPGSDPLYFDRYPYRFAFLEPLACGVPVIGSTFDDPSERDDPVAQQLVIQVDPNDRADIKRGLLQALARRGNGIHPFLSQFSYEAFEKSAHGIMNDVLRRN